MSNLLPKSVNIFDDTMREGLQIENPDIPVSEKLRLLDAIGEMGAAIGATVDLERATISALRAGEARIREGKSLLAAVPECARVVALDEGGRRLSSEALAGQLERWRDQGVGNVAFVIGGPAGLDAAVTRRADLVLSLGPMTWPHLLVRGLIAVLHKLYDGLPVGEVSKLDARAELGRLGLNEHLSAQRSNGLRAMVERIQTTAAAA